MQTLDSHIDQLRAVERVTLAESTVIEPLVANWCAWSFTLPPVPASLYFANYHLPLLESFIEQPESHWKAAADPHLSGGPFVNLAPSRVADVVQLRDKTVATYEPNARLACDLSSFLNEFARGAADGLALEGWYPRVPESIRPFVELVYDYQHRPHVRLIEPLLYRSEFYRRESQMLRLFTLNRDTDRPYFMNTPRLPTPGAQELFLDAPFDGDRTRALIDLAASGARFDDLCDRLAITEQEQAMLARMLRAGAPFQRTQPQHRYTYLGHASMMIHWRGTTVITDPVVTVTPADGGDRRLSFDELPERIDYVAITHNHHDHFAMETLMRLAPRIGTLILPRAMGFIYGDVSLKDVALRCGVRNVVELDVLESVPFEDGEIIAVPFLGEHSDLAHSKTAYVVRTGTQSAFFGADSDNLNEGVYAGVRSALGSIDSVFIGTEDVGGPLSWTAGPLLPAPPTRQQNVNRRSHGCDDKRALRIAELLGARRVFCYGMGLEPWVRHLLGAAMSADSPQLNTAHAFVALARDKGFESRLLNGVTSFD